MCGDTFKIFLQDRQKYLTRRSLCREMFAWSLNMGQDVNREVCTSIHYSKWLLPASWIENPIYAWIKCIILQGALYTQYSNECPLELLFLLNSSCYFSGPSYQFTCHQASKYFKNLWSMIEVCYGQHSMRFWDIPFYIVTFLHCLHRLNMKFILCNILFPIRPTKSILEIKLSYYLELEVWEKTIIFIITTDNHISFYK